MADEVKVELKKLPANVFNKAKQMLPKTTWHAAVKVQDGDKVAYELDGTNGNDNDVTVTITAEGKMVEWDVKLSDPTKTPAIVQEALTKKWPAFTLTESHLIHTGEDLKGPKDGEHVFDIHGTRAQGKRVSAQVSPKGEILEFVNEADLARVPQAVKVALKAKYPNYKEDTVYVVNENDKIIGFKYEGKGPKGRERTVLVSPDGKHVELVEEPD